MSCDFKDTERPGPHYKGDVFDVLDYPWDLGIFHYPCTNTSVSGARWFKAKRMDGRQLRGGLPVHAWLESRLHIPAVAFEHPVSIINTLFREPDQIIQPHEYWHLNEPARARSRRRAYGCAACASWSPRPRTNRAGTKRAGSWGRATRAPRIAAAPIPGIADAMAEQPVLCGPVRPYYPEYGRHTYSVRVHNDHHAEKRWRLMRQWVADSLKSFPSGRDQ
jgi:hypothetical protein